MLPGVEVDHVETQPRAASVASRREPSLSRGDDVTRDRILKAVDDFGCSTRRLPAGARDREIATLEHAEPSFPEQCFEQPCEPDIAFHGRPDGPPPVRAQC